MDDVFAGGDPQLPIGPGDDRVVAADLVVGEGFARAGRIGGGEGGDLVDRRDPELAFRSDGDVFDSADSFEVEFGDRAGRGDAGDVLFFPGISPWTVTQMLPSGPATSLLLVPVGEASGKCPSTTGTAEAVAQSASRKAIAAGQMASVTVRRGITVSLGELSAGLPVAPI